MGKQNDNFSHILQYCKTQAPKKNVLLQSPFDPKIGVFQLWFFETKNIAVEQKT